MGESKRAVLRPNQQIIMTIGIDIGGINIKGVLLKGNRVIAKIKVSTKSKTNKKIILGRVFECIEDLLKKGKVNKIGIGVAGPIDFKEKKVLNPPNVTGLKNVYLVKEVQNKFKIRTILDNDANCFALAETLLGAGKGKSLVVGLTLGTGIGGGIVMNKKLLYGADGSAGEIGHMIIKTDGRKCSCGNKGCLEVSFKKDKKYLGIGLANIVNILNPDIIVIGGGVSNLGEKLLKPARKEMKKRILSPLAKNTPVVRTKLGEFSGAIGAALLRQY